MLGRTGLRTMGLQNLESGARLEKALAAAGQKRRFTGAFYNELVTQAPDAKAVHEQCLRAGVHAGWDLAQDVPRLQGCLLWGSTPVHVEADYKALGRALGGGA